MAHSTYNYCLQLLCVLILLKSSVIVLLLAIDTFLVEAPVTNGMCVKDSSKCKEAVFLMEK